MKLVFVEMPDWTRYGVKHLLSKANHKQQKGIGYLSVGLTLTPRATGRSERNLCPNATPGCSASCFAGYDRMAWPQNKRAAVARTRLLANEPDLFLSMLLADLHRAERAANTVGVRLVVRLNVVSDIAYEREFPTLFHAFPDVKFMDYTKDVARVLDPNKPRGYHLTFSRSEHNEDDCLRVLAADHNVTVVFRKPPFPSTFWGYPVVDGDQDDLRFLDPSPCVVGLKAKGHGARKDVTGFVVDHPPRINFPRMKSQEGRLMPLPMASDPPQNTGNTVMHSVPHPLQGPMHTPDPHLFTVHSRGLWPQVHSEKETTMPRPKLHEETKQCREELRLLILWKLATGEEIRQKDLQAWLANHVDTVWSDKGRPGDLGTAGEEAESTIVHLLHHKNCEVTGAPGSEVIRLVKPIKSLEEEVARLRVAEQKAKEIATEQLREGAWINVGKVLPPSYISKRLSRAVKQAVVDWLKQEKAYEVRTVKDASGQDTEDVRRALNTGSVTSTEGVAPAQAVVSEDVATAPVKQANSSAGVKPFLTMGRIELVMLPIDRLHANPWNPNALTGVQENQLDEENRRDGCSPQPPLVRPVDGGDYQILDGEQNWKSDKRNGRKEILCRLIRADDFEAMRLTYVHNRHGTMCPLATGRLFLRMLELRGMRADLEGKSLRTFARENNLSEGTVRNYLLFARAAEMRKGYAAPETADETIRELSVAQVRKYLSLPEDKRDEWLDRGANGDEAARMLEDVAKKAKPSKDRTELKMAETAAPVTETEENIEENESEGSRNENPADEEQQTSVDIQGQQMRAEPVSEDELKTVDEVLKVYRESRIPVRHKILAGLAAQSDAVTFFRKMIKQGG